MNDLLQRVESVVNRRKLFSRGKNILIAVSGGVDSMVLVEVLNQLASKYRWRIALAHFNHQLRGRAGQLDEKLVRLTAKKLNLPLYTGRANVAQYARRAKLSIEMAARKLRHEFLAQTARAQKTDAVALAHHADDQVELFFLRLFRGAGGEGLAGMKWQSASPADSRIKLVRPLLGFAKHELLEFAQAGNVKFRQDQTNFSTEFLRNRIRHKLLPRLKQDYSPGSARAVLRLMNIVGAEAEHVAECARHWLRDFRRFSPPTGKSRGRRKNAPMAIQSFTVLPLAVQRKVLQLQLTEMGVQPDFDLIEELRVAVGQWVTVENGRSIAREASGEVICRKPMAHGFDLAECPWQLTGRAGHVFFGSRKFCWQLKAKKNFALPRKQLPSEFFDADRIGKRIVLRHWRAGDRFQPMGFKSAVKLQDLFVNAKIPAAQRRRLVLAATEAGEVFWVEGLRIGEKFKILPETKRVFGLKWSEIGA